MALTESLVVRGIFGVVDFVRSQLSELFKQRIFKICFVDHDPPGSVEIAPWTFYSIPLGTSEHWVKAVTTQGFPASDMNIRFLSEEEAASAPGNAPESIRSTIELLDICLPHEIEQQGHTVTRTKDRHGGIDLKFRPPYAWGTGRAIFLKILVNAKQVWSGKISFRAYDKDFCPRYARADVRVIVSK
jgi:hypothetical protein